MDLTFATPETDAATPAEPGLLRRFFGVVARGRTYTNLAYIWLAFPLGLTYFVFLVTGFSVGLGLAIILWGFVLLALLLGAVYGLAAFERGLAVVLLGAAPAPMSTQAPAGSGPLARFGAMLSSPSLWKGLVFLVIKFPLGLSGWVVSLVSLVLPLSFLLAPLAWYFGGVIDFGWFAVEGLAGAIVLSLVGALWLIAMLHLNNGIAWLWGRTAELLLGGGAAPAAPTPVPASLTAAVA
jgi:Putative sensor